MKNTTKFLRVVAQLVLVGALVLVMVVLFRVVSGGKTSSLIGKPSETPSGYPIPVERMTETDMPYPPPYDTPDPAWTMEPEPTSPPTPTIPSFPTPPPTPVVTPVPVATPPFIPDVVGKAQKPFWIVYWQDNEIWRIDDQGNEKQLLLDTYNSLGQWLTGHPMQGSD